MGPKIFSTLDKFPHYTKYITLILLAGTIEFVRFEQISALFKFRLIHVSLYKDVLNTRAAIFHFRGKMLELAGTLHELMCRVFGTN
jgi:hypothetical protein